MKAKKVPVVGWFNSTVSCYTLNSTFQLFLIELIGNIQFIDVQCFTVCIYWRELVMHRTYALFWNRPGVLTSWSSCYHWSS